MKKKTSAFLLYLIIFCMAAGCICTTFQVSAESTAQQEYTKRYKKLNKKCKKKFPTDLPQVQLNMNAEEEYRLWDDELNYVYNDIMPKLSDDQKKQLTASELKWIKKKEKQAKQDASINEGGSIYPLVYYNSLTRSTKKRIRWLIKNYA